MHTCQVSDRVVNNSYDSSPREHVFLPNEARCDGRGKVEVCRVLEGGGQD